MKLSKRITKWSEPGIKQQRSLEQNPYRLAAWEPFTKDIFSIAQPRTMSLKEKDKKRGCGKKILAYGLAGFLLGAPLVFAHSNNTTADVYLQFQLPDGYTQVGNIYGTAVFRHLNQIGRPYGAWSSMNFCL